MERLGPVGGDCIQPAMRPREAPGHRGDRVRVTAEVDRRAVTVGHLDLKRTRGGVTVPMIGPWEL